MASWRLLILLPCFWLTEAIYRRFPQPISYAALPQVPAESPPDCSMHASAAGCVPAVGRQRGSALPAWNRTNVELLPTCHTGTGTGDHGPGCLRLAATTAAPPAKTAFKVEASTGAADLTLLTSSHTATAAITNDGVSMFGDYSSATWVDVDNDGDLDLFLVHYAKNRLFKNNLNAAGVVSFVMQSSADGGTIVSDGGSPVHGAWGDWDNDGDMDCYVSHQGTASDRLYINDGSGKFTTSSIFGDSSATFRTTHWTTGAAWGDLDNDGYLDLVTVARKVTSPPSGFTGIFLNQGGASFSQLTASQVGVTISRGNGVALSDVDVRALAETACSLCAP